MFNPFLINSIFSVSSNFLKQKMIELIQSRLMIEKNWNDFSKIIFQSDLLRLEILLYRPNLDVSIYRTKRDPVSVRL